MNDMAVATSTAALSPLALFLHADLVVKIVMLGLLGASLWTWTIILGRGLGLGRVTKADQAFERDFWKAGDVDRR